MKKGLYIISLIFLSCSFPRYTFNGGDVGEAKTFSVIYFENKAILGPATLSQTFTEALRDLIQTQSPLTLIADNGDLIYEGGIIDYRIEPLAIQQDQTAARNRLSITVNVKYTNSLNEKKDFSTSFSRFSDYEVTSDISSIEASLITDIFDQITQDIYNKSLGDW